MVITKCTNLWCKEVSKYLNELSILYLHILYLIRDCTQISWREVGKVRKGEGLSIYYFLLKGGSSDLFGRPGEGLWFFLPQIYILFHHFLARLIVIYNLTVTCKLIDEKHACPPIAYSLTVVIFDLFIALVSKVEKLVNNAHHLLHLS